MKSQIDLKKILQKIDGRGYKAYRELKGEYDFGWFRFIIDHVQADPFAAPSRVRVRIPMSKALFPNDTFSSKSRCIALRDYLTRRFYEAAIKISKGHRGTGKSGLIAIDKPGQEILERTSCFVNEKWIEERFVIGLPAFGRRVAGKQAEEICFSEVPQIIRNSLVFSSLESFSVYKHITVSEDADAAREMLGTLGLVSWIADGSILPRASGIDQRPLSKGRVVPFKSPESLRIELILPNGGRRTGMGIPKGVTLIVGGGYHGKSTLLKSIQDGIYNHIPGDGREFVVTDPFAIKIRAEDGRRIEKVNISSFINNLPFGRSTEEFSTDDASGSTSQAANILEAIEVGATVLLMDEDTSATNFMIRDHRMQELVVKNKEPITPFIDKVRQLYHERGISTILAMGGSGDYFDVADHVVCMIEYRPYDFTLKAREIAQKYPSERKQEGGRQFGTLTNRIPLASSFDPRKGKREVKISLRGLKLIDFGIHRIELGAVEQLVDVSQTKAVGDAIYYATRYMDGRKTLFEVVTHVEEDIASQGLDVLSFTPVGDYAAFRGLELAAAINRMRTLRVRHSGEGKLLH